MYLIEILHQTTTNRALLEITSSCILSKFYIKPQHTGLDLNLGHRCILSKFYIKPQHICRQIADCPVVSYRNSTSNHNPPLHLSSNIELYLIEILHQTTTLDSQVLHFRRCILSKFYIKPQHHDELPFSFVVVSYRNSTSNHNIYRLLKERLRVVSYRNSTSNHNRCRDIRNTQRVVSYRNSTSNHN